MPPITIQDVSGKLPGLLNAAPTDWVANECLANDARYAKPDAEKYFLLWEAKGPSIEITALDGLEQEHPWLFALFVIDDTPGRSRVRFPYNPSDSVQGMSICPVCLPADNSTELLATDVRALRRWSSASRSCFALIPQVVPAPVDGLSWETDRRPLASRTEPCISQTEWANANVSRNRFYDVVKGHLGAFCSAKGKVARGDTHRSRLYSVKTGVSYVGSMYEEPFGKNVLEANSKMAMVRSAVVHQVERARTQQTRDDKYRVQIELLTITAKCEIDSRDKTDGFQVRDLSCMRDNETCIPAHAIPYNGRAFSKADGAADCDFWITNFALPCGRAKARMFLDYGLIHSSANAQNFIVSFRGDHFASLILRDIGDTYWHDDYITQLLGSGHPAYTAGVSVEKAKQHKHLLHETTSTDYPAPHLVRIAAHSVITHGFADKVVANRGWSNQDVLRFTQALLSGFRDYCGQTIGFKGEYPQTRPGHFDPLELGRAFAYPSGKYTQQSAETYLENHAQDALAVAGHVRRESANILGRQADKLKTIELLIQAEEMALCAALELYLRNLAKSRKLAPKYQPLAWWGSVSEGIECGTCRAKHGTVPSSGFGRWHLCLYCGVHYCSSCGGKLQRASFASRNRRCACGGDTALVE